MVRTNRVWLFVVASIIFCSLTTAHAQSTVQPTQTAAVVPQLVNFSGQATDEQGKLITGTANLTFAIYNAQYQGSPLWMETQNVTADSKGNYTVQLGAASAEGLPLDLFTSGEARWLGVRVSNGEEQPRVLLLSVPYALKAADAQTLGGMPASAFALAASPSAANGSTPATSPSGRVISKATSNVTTTGGTANTIPLFTTATNIQNSIMTQSGTTSVSVGGALNATGGLSTSGTVTATGVVSGGSFEIGANLFGFGSYSSANAFLGFGGRTNTVGVGDTGIGFDTLADNAQGNYDTATGEYALAYNTTGSYNTASGVGALVDNTSGNYNTASGDWALQSTFTGSYNTAMGALALFSNSSSSNEAFGYQSLYNSTSGPNEAFGYQAMYSNTSASNGQAFGYQALYSNTTGSGNQAFGYRTMYANTTGADNAAFGGEALYENTVGAANTAVGGSALYSNTSGSENTAVGQAALVSNTTGTDLTCIGFSCTAGEAIRNATAIGAHARVEQSNSLVLGGAGVNVGIGTTKPSNILTVARGAGHPVSDSWETYSSRRWKTNIKTLPDALSKVEQLRGVSYDRKDSGKHEIGVIAEEVGQVVPEVVSYESNGKDAAGVDYSRLTALLIEAVKQQQALIRKHESQIRTQRAQMKAQQAQIAHLASQVKTIQTAFKSRSQTGSEIEAAKAQVPVLRR